MAKAGQRKKTKFRIGVGTGHQTRTRNSAGRDNTIYVYFIQNEVTRSIKIGWSNDPWNRVNTLQTGNEHPLTIIGYYVGSTRREKAEHNTWKDQRINPDLEWFRHSDQLEARARREGCLVARGFKRGPRARLNRTAYCLDRDGFPKKVWVRRETDELPTGWSEVTVATFKKKARES
jgi:hypothetical protein